MYTYIYIYIYTHTHISEACTWTSTRGPWWPAPAGPTRGTGSSSRSSARAPTLCAREIGCKVANGSRQNGSVTSGKGLTLRVVHRGGEALRAFLTLSADLDVVPRSDSRGQCRARDR